MRKTAIFGMLGLLLVLPAGAFAHDDDRFSERDDYNAMTKLGRGLAGVTTGFLELPGNIVAVSRRDGWVGGMTVGFAKGLGMIPVRELVGVYDIVTSPFPAPGHYEPVVEPAYPWRYFEGEPDARLSAAMRGESRYATRHHDHTHSTSGTRR